jgi:hypothetical protein
VAERAKPRKGDLRDSGKGRRNGGGEVRREKLSVRGGVRMRGKVAAREERTRKERHSISLLVISREIFGFVGKILF